MQISDGDWDFVRKALNGSSFSVVMPFYRLVAAAETNLKAVADTLTTCLSDLTHLIVQLSAHIRCLDDKHRF